MAREREQQGSEKLGYEVITLEVPQGPALDYLLRAAVAFGARVQSGLPGIQASLDSAQRMIAGTSSRRVVPTRSLSTKEVPPEAKAEWNRVRGSLRPFVAALRNPSEALLAGVNSGIEHLVQDVIKRNEGFTPSDTLAADDTRILLSDWFDFSLPEEVPPNYRMVPTKDGQHVFVKSLKPSGFILPQYIDMLRWRYGLETGEELPLKVMALQRGTGEARLSSLLSSAQKKVGEYNPFIDAVAVRINRVR